MSQTANWKTVPLSEACEFTKKPPEMRVAESDQIPFVPMELIPEGSLYCNRFILKSRDSIRSGTYFERGDILLAKITPSFENGKQAIIEDLPLRFGFATTEVIPFREIPGISEKLFLFYYLLHPDVRAELAGKMEGTTGRQRLNRATVERLAIPLPPLSEQRAIARALQAVQRAKETRQRELALERERKAVLMEYLFTHGTHGEPRTQTEIGEIPATWRLVKLGSIARIGNGSTPKRSDVRYWSNGTLPWITSTQVHDLTIRHAHEFVTETARMECHLPLVPKGSIVVAITGQGKTLGNAAILALDVHINQHLAYITFQSESVHSHFVLFYLQSRYEYLRGVASGGGSTKGALTCGFLKNLSIPVPPLDEQEAMAALFLACEAKCSALASEIALLDELFRAMLEELMTGRLSAVPLIEEGRTQ